MLTLIVVGVQVSNVEPIQVWTWFQFFEDGGDSPNASCCSQHAEDIFQCYDI